DRRPRRGDVRRAPGRDRPGGRCRARTGAPVHPRADGLDPGARRRGRTPGADRWRDAAPHRAPRRLRVQPALRAGLRALPRRAPAADCRRRDARGVLAARAGRRCVTGSCRAALRAGSAAMSIIERALAKAKRQDRAAVEEAEGLAHRPEALAPEDDGLAGVRASSDQEGDASAPRVGGEAGPLPDVEAGPSPGAVGAGLPANTAIEDSQLAGKPAPTEQT